MIIRIMAQDRDKQTLEKSNCIQTMLQKSPIWNPKFNSLFITFRSPQACRDLSCSSCAGTICHINDCTGCKVQVCLRDSFPPELYSEVSFI